MHRLLQEMGRSIVRLEEPEKREFLVDSQDICDVLTEGTGTQKILGISLNIDETGELYVHEDAFTGMRNLRFLKFYSKYRVKKEWDGEVKLQLPKNFKYLPPKLKLLHWDEYPMRCMPSKFRPENLVKLRMANSKLEKLWEGVVSLTCLKEMSLWGSQNLIEIPDLSKATNLETLNLVDCYSLVKLPSSFPHPNKLRELDMKNCRNLETIPTGISLKSLEKLYLNGCSRLRTFPQISTNIVHLYLSETAIEEFPSNLYLENLFYISMRELKSKKLWERVQPLTLLTAIMSPSLMHLYLSDISTLVELPSSFQNLHQLCFLEIKNCLNLETLPTGMNLRSLWKLDLSGCSKLKTFPGISTNIKYLDLSKTAIEEVPWWIEKFSWLQTIKMNGCNKLKTVSLNIYELTQLERVDLSDCKALTGASWNDSTTSVVSYFERRNISISFNNCSNLDQDALFQQKTYLGCKLNLSGEQVPSYFTHRTTATSSSLTIPLLPSSLSQSLFRFRACIVPNCDEKPNIYANFIFKGRFWNSFGSAQDFLADAKDFAVFRCNNGSCLLILDCQIPLEMNFDHVDMDMEIHVNDCTEISIKEWGIRIIEENLDQLRLSGEEEVPSYFAHRTTGTSPSSSYVTIPLLPTSLSQPFLRFSVCIVFDWDNTSAVFVDFMLRGWFWNSSDAYEQAEDFCADTEYYEIFPCNNDSRLFILDCQMYDIPLEMNFDHVDLEIHAIDSSDNLIEIKEWGIRIIEEEDC
ncbi:hypothetical protein N665_0012s0201 [Sinapis alba]|nr:hypothetical protein N665_0012s0201 [Sinapis alba]KAF8117199.1 hypothetical protein N665_0012s0201 [Sinapis alba]